MVWKGSPGYDRRTENGTCGKKKSASALEIMTTFGGRAVFEG